MEPSCLLVILCTLNFIQVLSLFDICLVFYLSLLGCMGPKRTLPVDNGIMWCKGGVIF